MISRLQVQAAFARLIAWPNLLNRLEKMNFTYYLLKIVKANDMEWDKFRMAQKFLQRANAIHPEDAVSSDQFNEALALQDVYYDCYMSSFSRVDLIKRLQEILAGKIIMPEEEEVDEEKYRATFAEEARRILTIMEAGKDIL